MDGASSSYKSLREKFEATRKELGQAEETIKRITGRDPNQFQGGAPGMPRWRGQPGAPPMRPFQGGKRPLFPIIKFENDDEDSPEEDEAPYKKPSVSSTVVAIPKEVKSRKETIKEQNVNSKVEARNRRMFGMILGTLQKFQKEETKRKEQDIKKAEVEKKVEAAAAEEKERLKKEKEELFLTRKEKKVQLRCLEKKMEVAELHEVWERSTANLINFIQTKAEPHIFFLPVQHTPETEKALEESKTRVLDKILSKREQMDKQLAEVEELYNRKGVPNEKENLGPEPGESETIVKVEVPDPTEQEQPSTNQEAENADSLLDALRDADSSNVEDGKQQIPDQESMETEVEEDEATREAPS